MIGTSGDFMVTSTNINSPVHVIAAFAGYGTAVNYEGLITIGTSASYESGVILIRDLTSLRWYDTNPAFGGTTGETSYFIGTSARIRRRCVNKQKWRMGRE
jgi:hypothetical protein